MKDPRFYHKRAGEVLEMIAPELLERFNALKKSGEAAEIWLFGSIVKNRDMINSDIDLMLDVSEASPRMLGRAMSEIADWFNFPIHFLLSDGKNHIPNNILQERVRLCDWMSRDHKNTSAQFLEK